MTQLSKIQIVLALLLIPVFSFSQDWNPVGNTITASTDYLGTDNSSNQPLRLKTGSYTGNDILFQTNGANTRMTLTGQGTNAGFFGINSASPAYRLDVTGDINIASNTTQFYRIGGSHVLSNAGTNNTFLGVGSYASSAVVRSTHLGVNSGAGTANGATDNTLVGFSSGNKVTTGVQNTIVGSRAGETIDANDNNTFIGYRAGENSAVDNSTFVGAWAGQNNSTGTFNSFFGTEAGSDNFSGSENALFGYQSGLALRGSRNTMMGSRTGSTMVSQNDNVLIGYEAGEATTSNSNTMIGSSAGSVNSTGAANTFIGYQSGVAASTGSNNVFVGNLSGQTNTTGDNNTIIGTGADVGSSGLTNAIAIGRFALVTASNSLILGQTSTIGSGSANTTVGIGTSAPVHRLHINTPSGSDTYTQYTNSVTVPSGGGPATISNGTQIGVDASGNSVIRQQEAKSIIFSTHNGTGGSFGERVRIDLRGNVGIGVSSPTSILHTVASGTKTASYKGNLLTNTATSSTASIDKTGLEVSSTGSWSSGTAKNIGLNLSSVTGVTSSTGSNIGVNVASVSGGAGTNIGINVASVSGATNNYDAIFNGGGNVGVGTATPAAALDVYTGTYSKTSQFINASSQSVKYAVWGKASNNLSPTGVYGYADGGTKDNIGVSGEAAGSNGALYGVYGYASGSAVSSFGAWAESSNSGTDSYGLYARSASTGTNSFGVKAMVDGNATNNYAVYADYNPASPVSTNCAGFFDGDIFVSGVQIPSDSALKQNIQPLESSFEVLGQLHPKSYQYRLNDYSQMNLPQGTNYGLIAQDLEAVLPGLVRTFVHPAELDTTGNEISPAVNFKGINYTGLIPFLIGGIQEQQAQIEAQQEQIQQLQQEQPANPQPQIDQLQQQIQDLQNQINNCCQAPQGEGEMMRRGDGAALTATTTERAMLMQNVPNPFSQTISLGFYLPEQSGKAQIKIYGTDGQELRVYYLAGTGYGKINGSHPFYGE